MGLDQLGLPADMTESLRLFAERDSGMVVVTGPTGSGKTATLYGLIDAMDRSQRKVMTVEDPVEIRLPGTVQVPVNERIGLGFAQVLRAMLRQDPDVLLVGEMRDPQTVETGLRAAMTGHTVLSTLHTSSTASTPARLIDMGAPPFLVAMALRMVLAQRLVRKVCPACAAPRVLDAAEHAFMRRWLPEWSETQRLVQGVGCVRCHGTGCRGRIGVFELLAMDEGLADLLVRGDSVGFASAARQRVGAATLARHAVQRACAGEIPLDEAMRVALSETY
jgi:MSHA biogenesis protein MshE